MRKIIVVILFMVGFTAADILGQQNMTAKTQPSDDESAKKVDAFLSQWDKNDMPGCAVGLVKDGRLVYKRGFAMANLDYDVPNTPSTLFNLASASKPFTAFSIALLAQQGKLSLDDDIRKYVPEMPNYGDTIERSRDSCSIQTLMNERLKESLLSDDSRLIEQSELRYVPIVYLQL